MLSLEPTKKAQLQQLIGNVFEDMHKTGTYKITVTYSGSGDEGWSDTVTCLDQTGEVTPYNDSSPIAVFEFLDRYVIAGWEDGDGGCGTLTFTAPDVVELTHGYNEITLDTTLYKWVDGDFTTVPEPSIEPALSAKFKKDIQPILDLLPDLQESQPDLVGIVCHLYEEVDSGISTDVYSVYEGQDYFLVPFLLSPLTLTGHIKIDESTKIHTTTYLGETSITIVESLHKGSIPEDTNACVFYTNHPSYGTSMKCHIEVRIPKVSEYTL